MSLFIESELLSLSAFFEFITGKIFKILPLREDENESIYEYLDSLRIEMTGAINTFPKLHNSYEFMTLVNTINYLIGNEFDVPTCKREVFKMLKTVNLLQLKAGGDEDA